MERVLQKLKVLERISLQSTYRALSSTTSVIAMVISVTAVIVWPSPLKGLRKISERRMKISKTN